MLIFTNVDARHVDEIGTFECRNKPCSNGGKLASWQEAHMHCNFSPCKAADTPRKQMKRKAEEANALALESVPAKPAPPRFGKRF